MSEEGFDNNSSDSFDCETERCEDCGKRLEDCECIGNLFMTSDDLPD